MPDSPRRSPEPCAVQRAAVRALQSKVVRVDKLRGYLFRNYRLSTSTAFFYVLKCRPSNGIRLLRHEDDRLESEARALQVLIDRPDLLSARLIEYESTNIAIGSKYLISGPFSGSVLAEVEPSLSRQALADIDRSLGQYVRRLSTVTNDNFGPLRQTQDFGSRSWARMFALILEVVIRDGEDALINLPYDGMRELVRSHRSSLDRVTQPRLVLLELSADENVLVDPHRHRVLGVLDYSTAFWGDPFMSDCFYRPTASFAEGFGKLPNGDIDERVRQYL
jgi:aminoglycoside phosphotransferase (APT) family kinase protein